MASAKTCPECSGMVSLHTVHCPHCNTLLKTTSHGQKVRASLNISHDDSELFPSDSLVEQTEPCQVCGIGELTSHWRYQYGKQTAFIGRLIRITSLMFVFVSIVLAVYVIWSTANTTSEVRREALRTLQKASVPQDISKRLMETGNLSEEDELRLRNDQKVAAFTARNLMADKSGDAEMIDRLLMLLYQAIISACFALYGWLLVRKEQLLRCKNCSAIVPAS